MSRGGGYEDIEAAEMAGASSSGGMVTLVLTIFLVLAVIATGTIGIITYVKVNGLSSAAPPSAPTPAAGPTYVLDTASGCLYTNTNVTDVVRDAPDFYDCALYHDMAFYQYASIYLGGTPQWRYFKGCYWDLSNATQMQRVRDLATKITRAQADPSLKTTEKVRLNFVANEVTLATALVDNGHLFGATASYWFDYAWYDDPGMAAIVTTWTLLEHDFTAEADYDEKIMRFLGNVSAFMPGWTATMQAAVASQIVHADIVMQTQGFYIFAIYSFGFGAGPTFLDLCPTLNDGALVAPCTALATAINAAMATHLNYWFNTYLAACTALRPDALSGLGSTPNGVVMYDAWLAYHLGFVEAAEDIYTLGLARVIANRADLLATMQLIEPTVVTFNDAVALLLNPDDPRFYICTTNAVDVIRVVQLINAQIEEHLLERYAYLPRPRVNVLVTGSPSTFSVSGVYDETTNTWVQAPLYNIGQRPGCAQGTYYDGLQMSTVAHEAIPGHGLQLQIEAEVGCLVGGIWAFAPTSYYEGYGLYSEEEPFHMGVDGTHTLGLYTDDYNRLSFYIGTMLRNTRIVVDPGMHGRWAGSPDLSWSDCVTTMTGNGIDLAYAESECERYVQMPGQATAYVMGKIKLLDLRTQAATALGVAFDVREFHNVILHWGAMRFDDLAAVVQTWQILKLAADPLSHGYDALFGADILRTELPSRTLPDVGRGRLPVGVAVASAAAAVHGGVHAAAATAGHGALRPSFVMPRFNGTAGNFTAGNSSIVIVHRGPPGRAPHKRSVAGAEGTPSVAHMQERARMRSARRT